MNRSGLGDWLDIWAKPLVVQRWKSPRPKILQLCQDSDCMDLFVPWLEICTREIKLFLIDPRFAVKS